MDDGSRGKGSGRRWSGGRGGGGCRDQGCYKSLTIDEFREWRTSADGSGSLVHLKGFSHGVSDSCGSWWKEAALGRLRGHSIVAWDGDPPEESGFTSLIPEFLRTNPGSFAVAFRKATEVSGFASNWRNIVAEFPHRVFLVKLDFDADIWKFGALAQEPQFTAMGQHAQKFYLLGKMALKTTGSKLVVCIGGGDITCQEAQASLAEGDGVQWIVFHLSRDRSEPKQTLADWASKNANPNLETVSCEDHQLRAADRGVLGNLLPEDAITTFNGSHKWLSNFSWWSAEYEGIRYPSVEHAFQAAKLLTNGERRSWGFEDSKLSFGGAKRLGRQVPLREDWKEIREEVMAECLRSKFEDPQLRAKLLATGDSPLIDGHSGSPDLIWGYHFPSQAGENRLGQLLMDLRADLQQQQKHQKPKQRGADAGASGGISGYPGSGSPSKSWSARSPQRSAEQLPAAALFHLDWPMKCLHDGLPKAYAARIVEYATEHSLSGSLVLLPRRKICIALAGTGAAIDRWEHKMRTEYVDVNSKGRPCRERMLVELLRQNTSAEGGCDARSARFAKAVVDTWPHMCSELASSAGLPTSAVLDALGPEPPELPKSQRYAPNREAVFLDGKRFPLCLNESEAALVPEALLGDPVRQTVRGAGEAVPLVSEATPGKPSIFGGRFARTLPQLLDDEECRRLIELSEQHGYGLAGSRGFNPFARFALRCLLDAPLVAAALTKRLAGLLPAEYPPNSGRRLVGLNERCRFLKYLPGMHHAGDHTDCAHEDPQRGRSYITVQLYLSDGFSGGCTTFISNRLVAVLPAPGKAIAFDHELYHRGGMVTSGVKYAVRLDVLYGPPSAADEEQQEHQEKEQEQEGQAAERRRRGRWVHKARA